MRKSKYKHLLVTFFSYILFTFNEKNEKQLRLIQELTVEGYGKVH